MPYVIVAIFVVVTLVYALLGPVAWIRRYGRISEVTNVSGIDIPVRGGNINDVSYIVNPQYFDQDILRDTEIVLVDDIYDYSLFCRDIAGTHTRDFDFTVFKTKTMITMKKGRSDYAPLFWHEYLHAWLRKHTGDSDPFHKTDIWRKENV